MYARLDSHGGDSHGAQRAQQRVRRRRCAREWRRAKAPPSMHHAAEADGDAKAAAPAVTAAVAVAVTVAVGVGVGVRVGLPRRSAHEQRGPRGEGHRAAIDEDVVGGGGERGAHGGELRGEHAEQRRRRALGPAEAAHGATRDHGAEQPREHGVGQRGGERQRHLVRDRNRG